MRTTAQSDNKMLDNASLGLSKYSERLATFGGHHQKCGFEQEGYLKKHYLKDGQLIDARLYGLLR
jgi:hypothetical protein